MEKNTLYRCLDKLLEHKDGAVQSSCNNAGRILFGANFEVLLYDLTSTYFESDPPLRKLTRGGLATAGINAPTVCR